VSAAPIVRLTRESIIYGLGQSLSRGLQVILVPIFTRVFQPAEYGVIDVLGLVATIGGFFIIMGTDAALAMFFYKADASEDRRTLVSTLGGWRLGLALAVSLSIWVLAPFLSRVVLASPDYAKYLRITAWTLPLTLCVYFENDVLRMTVQPWKFIGLNLLNTLAVAGLSILFVVFMRRHVSGVLYGRLCGDGLTALVGVLLIRHTLVPRFDRALLRRALAFAIPLIPAQLSFWAISYADRRVLLQFTNLTSVGIYAVAVKLSALMVLGTSAFQLAWGPFAYAHAREEGSGRTFSRVLTLYAAVAAFLGLAIGLFAPEVLSWLVPPAYAGAAAPGALLVFGAVAFGGYAIVGVGANLAYRPELQAWCAAAAAVLTIGLALALVRPFGLLGVSVATLAGFLGSSVLLYVASQRVYPLPYRGTRALVVFLLAVAAWCGTTWATTALGANGHPLIGLSLRIGVLGAFAVIALGLARRIPPPVGPVAATAASAGA